MKKLIRWEGIIAFLVICAALTVLLIVFAGPITKSVIEANGTALVGAKVELNKAKVGLIPLTLELQGLSVTNPDQPMANITEVKRIAFTLDESKLLARKVIIDEMSLEGVRFNTARTSSGAVPGLKKKIAALGEAATKSAAKASQKICAQADFSLPSLEIPDIQSVLAGEQLSSMKEVAQLKATLQSTRDEFTKKIETLPAKKDFDQIKNRIAALKQSGTSGGVGSMLNGAGEINQIRTEIEGKIALIKNAKASYEQEFSALKSRVNTMKKISPLADVKRLKEKYSLSGDGIKNFSQAALGNKLCSSVQKVLDMYEKAKPVLEKAKKAKGSGPEEIKPLRAKGIDMRYKEKQPLPDFLIRKALVSVSLDIGDISGKIENITPDQGILGKPLKLAFSGKNLPQLQSAELTGIINHINPQRSINELTLAISGFSLEDIHLSESAELPITLTKAMADFTGKATLNGDDILADFKTDFQAVEMASTAKTEGIIGLISQALTNINKLNINTNIAGKINDYTLKIDSNIDEVVANAVGDQVKKLVSGFEKKLTAQISEKLNGQMKGLQGNLGSLGNLNSEFTSRLNLGDNLLKDLVPAGLGGGSTGGGIGGFKLPF